MPPRVESVHARKRLVPNRPCVAVSPTSTSLWLSNDRATIQLAGRNELDETRCRRGQDLIVGRELRTVARRLEDDLHLLPERIHAIRGDGVDDAGEGMTGVHALVALIDVVDRAVIGEIRRLPAGGQFR